jgi:hypothetical protein
MPFWCGYAERVGSGFWWIFPLFGLLVMVVMAFGCFRGFGCMGRRARGGPGDVSELRREFQELKEDVRKLLRQAS